MYVVDIRAEKGARNTATYRHCCSASYDLTRCLNDQLSHRSHQTVAFCIDHLCYGLVLYLMYRYNIQ